MKTNWQTKKLGDIFDIKSSKRVHKSDWKDHGIPFYRAREVVKLARDGYVDNDLFISNELYNEFTREKGSPQSGDLIVSAVGTLGKCYLVKKSDKFYFKDASVLWFSNNGNVEPKFIEYAFESNSILKQVFHKSMGATVGTLTISRAKNIKLSVPSLPEQQRIVKILDETFKKLEIARINTEKNLRNAKELFESYLQSVFTKKGKDWEEKTLGDIGKPSMCKRILKHQTSSVGEIPFYKIGTFGKTPNAFISKEIYNEFRTKYSFPKKGDILISASGTIGRRVRYDGEPAFFQDSNIVWISNDEKQVLNDYLYVFYEFCDWRPSKGATIARLYNSNLTSIKIVFPKSLGVQKEIIKKLDALSAKTKKLEKIYQQKIDNLDELKKSILQKAFNGEL